MKLTLRDVARFPRPGAAIPGKIAFAPGGRAITFLHSPGGGLTRELWSLDLRTGERARLFDASQGVTEETLTREEALRRERQRLRETGVTHYAWAQEKDVLMVPSGGAVHVLAGGTQRRMAEGAVDPHLSRDGRLLGFVREGALFVAEVATGEEKCLSRGDGVTHGLAEFVAQEEMGRSSGFWFSRDGRTLAFEEVDDRHIPAYPIVHQGKERIEIEEHRYPFAGERNAKVRLGIVSADGGPVRWVDVGEDRYLARVAWHPDGRAFVQIQSRDQRRLELWAYGVDGRGERILVEESPTWVNLHHDLRFLEGGEFLWASERTGFKHLYLYDRTGTPIRTLTSGPWAVDGIAGVTEREVYFAGGRESPLERHLYRVPLSGGEPERLTRGPGMHDAIVARDGSAFVDIHDSRSRPYSVTVRRADGAVMHLLHASEAVELPAPEIVPFRSRDGETLYMALYKPERLPAPCVVEVYGGPHVQMVNDGWMLTADLRAQYLAQQGHLVVRIDNRGSARRGLAFETAIAGRMGTIEVRDQVDGVRHLASQGLIDANRVGVFGWSYGGYMAAMCLAQAGEVFRAAVAGAPVTAWEGYDTHYTERYMRSPQENQEGYRGGSVLTHVEKIRGALLVIHGMLDENVHFRHTARLVQALVRARKPHELLLLPDERHMPRGEEDRVTMEERLADFFSRRL